MPFIEPTDDPKPVDMESLWLQGGGTVSISYGNLEIVAPRKEVVRAITMLRGERDRARLMRRVKHCIELGIRTMNSPRATAKKAIQCAQDIALWYANEIIEGRQKLNGG
jgi:hypothetical protein